MTRENFKLHGAGQEWRKFPPEHIDPGNIAIFGSCSKTLVTGTAASITFKARVDLEEALLWFRWQNPFRKLVASKKALFESPSRFKIVVSEDTRQSSGFIADSDIFKITYTVTFDPMLEPSSACSDRGGLGASTSDLGENLMKEWVDLEKERDGPKMRPVEEGALGQVMETSFGATKYYADWIPVLQSAARSVLITILNDTGHECKRSDWSLKRGLWRAIPSETLSPRKITQFGTASHGLLGFRSGTIGTVTYILKLVSGEYILTFHWKNHMVWGISNHVDITSTVSDATSHHIMALTESNNDTTCEITWTITEGRSDAKPTAAPSASPSTSTATDAPVPIKTTIKRTVVTRAQEDGETCNLTGTFAAARNNHLAKKKAALQRTENNLELVAHAVIQRARKIEEQSFFSSLFTKDPTLEDEAELVAPTVTVTPVSTPACPITGTKFNSDQDKRYCYVCGNIVHRSVVVQLPMPAAVLHNLKELKKPPKSIQVCLECNDILAASERPNAWRRRLRAAQSHPALLIHSNLLRNRTLIKSSLQDLRKMKAVADKDTEIVVNKILALFAEMESSQMQLFALNEDSPRAEQRLNNTMALFITNWSEEMMPELEALRDEK